MIWYPLDSSQITAAEDATNDDNSGGNNDTSVITYDHLGNHLLLWYSDIHHVIKKVSIAWSNYGRILHSDLFHINTLYRIFVEKTSRKKDQIHWDE